MAVGIRITGPHDYRPGIPLSPAEVGEVVDTIVVELTNLANDPRWRDDEGRVAFQADVGDLIHASGAENVQPQDIERSMAAIASGLRKRVPGADWSDNGAGGWEAAYLFLAPASSLEG